MATRAMSAGADTPRCSASAMSVRLQHANNCADRPRRTRFFNKPCCENAMPCAQVNPGHGPLSQQTERQCSVNGTSAPLLLQKGVPLQSHAWQPTIMHPDGKTEHGGHARWVCIHTTAEICELQACHDGLVAQIQCALAGNTVVAACLQVATVRQ